MPLFNKNKKAEESSDSLPKGSVCLIDKAGERQLKKEEKAADKEGKAKNKEEKTTSKRDYKIDKIEALTGKALAVAKKRKWLVFLLGLGLVIYFVVTSGGAGGMGGIFEKIKSFF